MSGKTFIERLADIDAAVVKAERRAGKARDERRARTHQQFGVEATAELAAYSTAVSFKQREPDPDEHRRLTLDLIKRIERDGLVLDTLGRTGTLQIVDSSIRDDYDEAHAAVVEARRARREFTAEHADAIEAERKAAEMESLRGALAGDDPEAVKAALGTGAAKNVLTTAG